MKRINYFLPVMTFLAGSFITLSLIGVVSYANLSSSSNPSPPQNAINSTTAKSYFDSYYTRAVAYRDTLKGIAIDREQFDAMTLLFHNNSTLAGFRIYFGIDGTSNLGIVVGVDRNGLDATGIGIFKTTKVIFGPCPPVCDNNSPIIK